VVATVVSKSRRVHMAAPTRGVDLRADEAADEQRL